MNSNPMMQLFQQQNLTSNPFFLQAQRMTQGKSEAEIKQIIQNVCREKGINFDEAFSIFQTMMKGI